MMCKQSRALNWLTFVASSGSPIYWSFFAFFFLGLLLIPKGTSAQGSYAQCILLLEQMTKSNDQQTYRQGILLARRYLANCRYDNRDYAAGLSALAMALNGDNQNEEAVAVANRCLQTNEEDVYFICAHEKAFGLYRLGRLQEAKTNLENALRQPAITENDNTTKQVLRRFLKNVNAQLETMAPTRPAPPPRTSGANDTNGISSHVGLLSGLPGGMMCADILNNGQEWCTFAIAIGEINRKLVDGIKILVNYKHQSKRQIVGSMVYLDSPGGDVAAALEIGRILRSEGMSATVERGAHCMSACVFVLAGAEKRRIDGIVGIHRPRYPIPNDPVNSANVIKSYEGLSDTERLYLKEMGVSTTLVDEMLRFEPDNIRILTRPELDKFGLGESPAGPEVQKLAAMKEALILKIAQAYGLSRDEYMRRDALIERTCKLSSYQRPDEPVDFSQFGRTEEELKMSESELLKVNIVKEEKGWSRCYKAIMTYGH
jgi:tetratricopeptide (TPR) repeat protein